MVDPGWQQAGLRVTVALWGKPCGEACAREPVAALVVELSPLEPAASCSYTGSESLAADLTRACHQPASSSRP